MKKLIKFLLGFVVGFVAAILVLCLGLFVANQVNEKYMHEYIDSFARVEYESQLKPQLDEYGNWYFTTDGDFKIMHITDVHLGGGCLARGDDKKALNAIAAMVSYEKPDLVIATGDIASTYITSGSINNRYSHEYFARLMENLGVYWTVTLGNHESEVYNVSFSCGKSIKNVSELLLKERIRSAVGRSGRVVILDEIAKMAVLLFTDRSFKRYGVLGDLHDLADLLGSHLKEFCNLIRSRLSAKLL